MAAELNTSREKPDFSNSGQLTEILYPDGQEIATTGTPGQGKDSPADGLGMGPSQPKR
jgi:hypothetical protein